MAAGHSTAPPPLPCRAKQRHQTRTFKNLCWREQPATEDAWRVGTDGLLLERNVDHALQDLASDVADDGHILARRHHREPLEASLHHPHAYQTSARAARPPPARRRMWPQAHDMPQQGARHQAPSRISCLCPVACASCSLVTPSLSQAANDLQQRRGARGATEAAVQQRGQVGAGGLVEVAGDRPR